MKRKTINPDLLKYRVFLTLPNKYDDGGCVWLSPNGEVAEGWRKYTELETLKPDFYVIERCTGKKDKNGTLIYEGDILQYTYLVYGAEENDCYHAVSWSEEDACWDFGASVEALKNAEIVGNIHTNKCVF